MKGKTSIILAALLFFTAYLSADHVILDDCIIDGSMCVGLDCVNGENFGFDTIRMKENNLRFHFDDTSVAAAFPRNDWRFIANDSANGGDSYLGIEDTTGGRIPFRVEAGASSNSLFVESTGDVGFGTNNPVVRMHSSDGDTPTVRLEQNGTSGWNPQTWDVAGNETNFFIRDVTHGSKLPFRIRPDAPTSSLEIEADGNIDIGKSMVIGTTVSELRVVVPDDGAGGGPGIQVGSVFLSGEDDVTPATDNVLRAIFSNNTWWNGSAWAANAADSVGGTFRIVNNTFRWHKTSAGAGVPTFIETAMLDENGDLDLLGVVGSLSDRNAKTEIEDVDTSEVLERLAEIPIATWRYKEQEGVTHMGPMAQDFYGAYELGKGDKRITYTDTSGVALASIQELHKRMGEKDGRIASLEAQNEELEARLARIEEALKVIK